MLPEVQIAGTVSLLEEKVAVQRSGSTVSSTAALAENENASSQFIRPCRTSIAPQVGVLYIGHRMNEISKRPIPAEWAAHDPITRMLKRAAELGHTDPALSLVCEASTTATNRGSRLLTGTARWGSLRDWAGVPGFRFHDLHHRGCAPSATRMPDSRRRCETALLGPSDRYRPPVVVLMVDVG